MSLSDTISSQALISLAEVHGDRRLYVPSGEGDSAQQLRELIGDKAFERLQFYYGGTRVWVPRLRSRGHRCENPEERDRQIAALSSTMSRGELAKRFDLSQSRIYGILQEAAAV